MKVHGILMTAILASLCGISNAAQQTPPAQQKEIVVNFSEVHVPRMIDDKNDLLVTAAGVFPNTCYTFVKAEVTHADAFTHDVKATANVKQAICAMMLKPFIEEINLGKFQIGKHTIRVFNGDGTSFVKEVEIK